MKRAFGDGAIEARGENTWRLRYRIKGQRFTRTVHGSKSDALKALRDLLHAGDVGTHVAPARLTVGQWTEHWLGAGCPGQRRKEIGARARERYSQLLRHVLPALGARPLQQLQSTEIDELYSHLATTMTAPTLRYVHIVLGSCLAAAARTGKISVNPMTQLVTVPANKIEQRATVLEPEQLRALVQGFKGSSLFLIVAVAAYTGARRGEILALQWSDLDVTAKTLRIERSVDETRELGLRLKDPKSERGKRTIAIDAELVASLVAERDRHLRLVAGVSESAPVDLSLVKLPAGALMFRRRHQRASRSRSPGCACRGTSPKPSSE
jgi:integrase